MWNQRLFLFPHEFSANEKTWYLSKKSKMLQLFPPTPSSAPKANVLMKLPAFWPNAAEVWFATDPQFSICSIIVSKSKLYHMVSVLPQEVASSEPILLEILTKFSRKGWSLSSPWMITRSGLPPSHWGSETLASDESDVCSSPGWKLLTAGNICLDSKN